MKAAVLYANRDLRYDDYKTPELKPGAVMIRVKATGICGSDVPRVLYNGAHFYPIVLGHEFSGEVYAVGEGVTSVKQGDRVTAAPLLPCLKCPDCQAGDYALCKHYSFIGSREQGAFAEYVVVPERNIIKFSDAVSFEQGAMFEPSTVALHGVMKNDFKGGGTVAVLGGGTIGIFTAQWARIFGAKTVCVFDIEESRLDLAARLGADCVIDSSKPDYMEDVKAIVGNRGFDYVFETAGQVPTMRMAFELAGNHARVCFIGTPHVPVSFDPKLWENLNRKEFNLTGSWMSYSAPFPGREWSLTSHCFGTGQLKFDDSLIFKRFSLSRAAEAFALFDTPGAVKGRILLVNE